MTHKHTPGPWKADTTNRWPEQVGCCPLAGRPYSIAGTDCKNVAAANTPEDACLIAAAPDLLDFVQEWLDRQGTDDNYMTAKARAAIAKAKGESK